MDLIPAIDILDGSVVRLLRGDYGAVTRYREDPVVVASEFLAEGATLVHVVDLDAARGRQRNLAAINALGAAGVPFQAGGGVRTADDAQMTMDAGARRVVVGSALLGADGVAQAIVERVGALHVVAAIDVAEGRARGSGWLDEGMPTSAVVGRVGELGVPRALVTGIDRDGTLDGPDTELLEQVAGMAPDMALIASGGVASLDDLAMLAIGTRCEAAIVGRALYERRFSVAEALAVLTDDGGAGR
jgi:phosphoribosylformimino-5-aminoimidazole carboxamide ribotide isomerase